jgi:hypothetical protein
MFGFEYAGHDGFSEAHIGTCLVSSVQEFVTISSFD